jgi:flagellar hook-length control protein FliK
MPVECPCPPSEALAVPGIPSAEAAAASPAETARRQTAAQADLPATGRAQAAALGTTSGGVAAADAAAVASAEKAGLAAAEAPAQGTRAAASPATAHAAADALGQAPAWSAATGPAGQEAQTPGAHPAAAAASADLAAAPGSDASALPAPAGTPGLSTGEARTAATAAPAAAAQAQLPAAPGHPAFPAQLASQLSIWVRAGVQQAQLHLNPAELGPVQVAIALEGSAAQVRLVAEHATTRQALEQALPALAGQLAEAGLMLAGGGVFDQSGPREGPATPGHQALRSRAPGSAAAADLPATGTTLPRPRGLVDLLA